MSLSKKIVFAVIFLTFCPVYQEAAMSEYMTFDSKQQDPAKQPLSGQKTDQNLQTSEIFARAEPAVVIIVLKLDGRYVGHGSGFFVKSNGYILTNSHVMDVSKFGKYADGITFEVVTSDGRTFTPQIIKADSDLDVALLKIDGNDLPYLKIGDVGDMKVGEDVFIIGSPIRLEFSRSLTNGVISGLNRMQGRIQTSAVIHRGNSGGPAFNNNGDVIGIAVAVAAGINMEKVLVDNKPADLITKQQYHGISYLIPINYTKNLLDLMY